MAGNIKGITIEFQGDTSKLDKSLRNVDKNTRSIDKELRNVNRDLKFNPTSVDLWRQKQQLLTQKVSETQQKLDILKQKQAQMDASGVDKNSEEYRKLQREIIETESKLKTFKGQLKAIGNVKLKALSEQFKQLGGKLTDAGNKMKGLSMAGGVVAGSVGALAYKSGVAADELNTLSKVTGISTEQLQKYNATADLVDVSTEAIAKSNVRLRKSMYSAADGTGTAAKAFEKLGVSVTNNDGSLKNSDEVFQEVLTALGSMSNETERDALAMQLMGKSATELNPMIEDMGETYKNVSDTLNKYGLDFVDQETLDKANEFNDELDTMKVLGQTALATVGTQLAAYLVPALAKVVDWAGKLAGWLSNLNPAVLTVIGVIAGVIALIAPILLILGKLAFAISSIISLVGTIGPAMAALAGPIGIVIAIIAALIAIGVLLYKNWDTIKAKLKALKQWFVNTWQTIKTKVSNVINGIKTAFSNAWTAIKTKTTNIFTAVKTALLNAWTAIKNRTVSTFQAVKNAILHPIQTARDKIREIIRKIKGFFKFSINPPHVPLPHFTISPAGWKLKDLLKGIKPTLSIKWYAQGGIFDTPTIAGIGEAGPEAVVPLDTLWKKLDALAENSGPVQPVVINVYGSDNMSVEDLAAAVEKRIIQMQKRRTQAWA